MQILESNSRVQAWLKQPEPRNLVALKVTVWPQLLLLCLALGTACVPQVCHASDLQARSWEFLFLSCLQVPWSVKPAGNWAGSSWCAVLSVCLTVWRCGRRKQLPRQAGGEAAHFVGSKGPGWKKAVSAPAPCLSFICFPWPCRWPSGLICSTSTQTQPMELYAWTFLTRGGL